MSSVVVTNEELDEALGRVQSLLFDAERDGCGYPQIEAARKVLIPLRMKLNQPPPPKLEQMKELTSLDIAVQSGFTGDPCPECGQLMMVNNGTCLQCRNCGITTGCS